MPDTPPLPLILVEPDADGGYCDPETGLCTIPEPPGGVAADRGEAD